MSVEAGDASAVFEKAFEGLLEKLYPEKGGNKRRAQELTIDTLANRLYGAYSKRMKNTVASGPGNITTTTPPAVLEAMAWGPNPPRAFQTPMQIPGNTHLGTQYPRNSGGRGTPTQTATAAHISQHGGRG